MTAPHLNANRIQRRTEGGPAPLSFAQNRLWFLDQLQPNNPAYNLLHVFRLTGALDLPILERAFNEVRRRHEILRANFESIDGQPVQVISPFQPCALTVLDYSDVPEKERDRVWHEAADAQWQKPFNLKTDPLMRAALLRFGPAEHLLTITLHHIICDGWSMRLIAEEIGVLYEGFSKGGASPLPDLPIQYSDYAFWQQQYFRGDVLEQHLAYWKKQLAGSPPVVELPTDHPWPDRSTNNGGCVRRFLPAELTEALKEFSQKHDATVFMVLLAAFQILIGRLSAQHDIVIGTPVSGRTQFETERLVGLFLNTIALRGDLSDNPTFDQLLQRVRSTVLDAVSHQDLPFDKLVAELQPDRSLHHAPLFQVMLNVLLLDLDFGTPGLTIETITPPTPDAKFDLSFIVTKRGPSLCVDVVYSADLFEAFRIQEIVDEFFMLLAQVVASPETKTASYSLITENSRRLLPDPTVAIPEPRFPNVTSEFLSRVQEFPARTALVQNDSSWTYEELRKTATAVAGHLMDAGVTRGAVVGVTGQRSFGLIGSILGVFLSGGILLTIDPNLPPNRRRLMLAEAHATHLIYVGPWRGDDEWMREPPGVQIIAVPENDASPHSGVVSPPEVDGDDPAYIFFTSGTTGIPKAVLGRHKGLSHFLSWQKKTFEIGPNDRVAQLTRLSFDVILRDIFLPLTTGGTLCLPDQAMETTSDAVLPWMTRARVTVFHSVPSLAQTWLKYQGEEIPRQLRFAFFAGEPLSGAFVEKWRTVLPNSTVVNLYGPTETTLVKTFHVVPKTPSHGIERVGQPLPETQILVLNKSGQLCGVGEPGEIVLRTPFRTLGYINAPEQQQKKFVCNRFRNDPDDLMYRTGDLGRYYTDGTVEFLGRVDDQVKIRGVRVEPAEIAATLSRHPALKGCFVLSRRDHAGNETLVAYVAVSPADSITANDLRSYLAEELPPVMIPSTFVFLESLPLTINGKVDRKALPLPNRFEPQSQRSVVPPRTPAEDCLAVIWRRILRTPQVGVHDDFFDVGGNSLLATQLVAHIRQEFNIDLPLRTAFTKPTIELMALHLLEQKALASGFEDVEQLLDELESLSEEKAEIELEHLKEVAKKAYE